ncbi:hypothetical protein NQ314_020164 [Rhamnusium bicolor]|uniref:Uncharacterized protein n=1 Tax=Rhamnusium bicolor TaxID=1586634 RepID=A0AAV8WLK2_9CUCU|nr:hypothetical protein NQ314_020164 [Rhamnusium bicolor]
MTEILALVRKPGKLTTEDYNSLFAVDTSSLADYRTTYSIETQTAILGSVAPLLIDISPGHYLQRQIVTFYQCNLQQTVCEVRVTFQLTLTIK